MDNFKELEKLDMITERIGCTYNEAREALAKKDGDVLEAIIYLEEMYDFDDLEIEFDDYDYEYKSKFSDKFKGDRYSIIESLKELLEKANATRMTIYDKDERVVLDIPVTAGAIGGVLFLPATLVALLGAVVTGCSLKIIREDGDEININDLSKDQFEKVKDSLDKFSKKVKEEVEKTVEAEDCEKESCCADKKGEKESCCADKKEEKKSCCCAKEEVKVSEESVEEEVKEEKKEEKKEEGGSYQ